MSAAIRNPVTAMCVLPIAIPIGLPSWKSAFSRQGFGASVRPAPDRRVADHDTLHQVRFGEPIKPSAHEASFEAAIVSNVGGPEGFVRRRAAENQPIHIVEARRGRRCHSSFQTFSHSAPPILDWLATKGGRLPRVADA